MNAAKAAEEYARSRSSTPSGAFAAELAAALADVKRALGAQNQAEREPLFYPAAELFKREYPPTSWLVKGLATRGGLVMIGGEPKTLKTWIASAIAVAVSSGTKVCGEFQAAAGAVAYFYAEDLDRQVRNRLRAELAGANLDESALANLYLRPRGKFIDVTKEEDLAWIIASCRRLGKLDLLVLDPLRDISSGEEDKSDSMRDVMRRLRLLGELLGGCTIAVVHHTAKVSENTSKRRPGQRLRGSSAIHGSVDSGIYFSDLDGDGSNMFRNVVDSEIKGARSAGRFELSLAIEDDDNGEAIRATWSVSRDGGRQSAKAAKATADDDAVFRFVRELATKGEHLSARGLRGHDGRPIPEKRFNAALDRLLDEGRLVRGQDLKIRLPEPRASDRERDSDEAGASGASVVQRGFAPQSAEGDASGADVVQPDSAPRPAQHGAMVQPPIGVAPEPAPEVPQRDRSLWGDAGDPVAPPAPELAEVARIAASSPEAGLSELDGPPLADSGPEADLYAADPYDQWPQQAAPEPASTPPIAPNPVHVPQLGGSHPAENLHQGVKNGSPT